ncbi:MAG: ABC transporter permease subunit [Candidatus Bipolaricaulaceae bacterium]
MDWCSWGVLRAQGLVNETITTLLLNYLAPLIVGYLVFGPWRAPELAIYPQTPEFPSSAQLPMLSGTRLHLGFFLGGFLLLAYAYLINRSRWGLELRVVGGNPEAARRLGLPVGRWMILAMAIGGALAGLAGIA